MWCPRAARPWPARRELLIEAAAGHADRVQDHGAHQLLERRGGAVGQHLLKHRIVTAGVPEPAAGQHARADRRGIRRRLAPEHLQQGRHRLPGLIPAEPVVRQPGSVGEQLAHSHPRVPPAADGGQLPGSQVAGDVSVQVQNALADQAQRPERGHVLADRTGLEYGTTANAVRPPGASRAIRRAPRRRVQAADRDADRWNAVHPHEILQASSILRELRRGRMPVQVRQLPGPSAHGHDVTNSHTASLPAQSRSTHPAHGHAGLRTPAPAAA